jgi:glutamate dehydrogenase/leucine dehydrogenase
MTLKAAAAGLDLGGGWRVIIGDPARDKTEGLLRAHGRFIAAGVSSPSTTLAPRRPT